MKRRVFNTTLSLLLSGVMAFSCLGFASSAVDESKKIVLTPASEQDYQIKSPYDVVNWDTWGAYKTQLHCHTNASDGFLTVKEVVQLSYKLGYDILAITDHGTLNRGWNKQPQLVPIIRLVKYERTKLAPIVPLTDEEYSYYLNGVDRGGRGMIDVPLGIELNAATPVCDCHLTGYFSEYGQGLIGVYGDYETPTAGVKAAGGISMLSHVGEYVYPKKDSKDHVGQKVDEYFVNKFARLFIDNAGSSVGMGINSATDSHTRCDRILYDQILQKTIPNGVVPWAFSFSDAHNEHAYDDAFTMHMMPEHTLSAFRTSMEDGTFFAVARYSYGYELNGMSEMPPVPEDYVADGSLNTPMVTRITVNDDADTISVQGSDFNQITWVSDGNVIARGMNYTTIDLDELDGVGSYVRFYITGPGGICYSQPMLVTVKGATTKSVDVPETHDLPAFLRCLVTVLDKLVFSKSLAVKIFKKIALGY